MDEILIGDKKYVSSKQAAKVTGYAKDYIGQLCREGRVPARLVGRNWYVLESAIHDHRFGKQKIEREKEEEDAATVIAPTWEAPRYEASSVENLPPLERQEEAPSQSEAEEEDAPLHESWKAWFDRITTESSQSKEPVSEKETQIKAPETAEPEEQEEEANGEEIAIPIRTIYHAPLKSPGKESYRVTSLMPHSEAKVAVRRQGRGIEASVKVVSLVIAVVSVILAGINTGYFDTYVSSVSQANVISGISTFNK